MRLWDNADPEHDRQEPRLSYHKVRLIVPPGNRVTPFRGSRDTIPFVIRLAKTSILEGVPF